ncbi:hypothetical protein [Euzebya rosea]|uniref:hypothetical protein n=1 Tax=Euzebya rosea TaxID=2052804 RepID=UPI000D3E8037|nr:hypothetical protein [Euzebya rosea]
MRNASTSVLALLLLLTCLACGDDSAGADAAGEATATVESEDTRATPTADTPATDTATTEPATTEPATTKPATTDDSSAPAVAAEPLGPIELEPTGEAICGVVADLDFSAVNDATDVPLQPGDDRCLWLPSDGRTIDFGTWVADDPDDATGETLLAQSTPGNPNTEVAPLTSLGRPALTASTEATNGVHVLLNDRFVLIVKTFEGYTLDELTDLASQFLAAAAG